MTTASATTQSAAPALKTPRTKAAKPKVKAAKPKAAPGKTAQKASKVNASKAAQAETERSEATQDAAADARPTPPYQDIFTLAGGDVKKAMQHFRIKLLEAIESIPGVHAVDVSTSKNSGDVEYIAYVAFPGRGPGLDTQFGIRIWEND